MVTASLLLRLTSTTKTTREWRHVVTTPISQTPESQEPNNG